MPAESPEPSDTSATVSVAEARAQVEAQRDARRAARDARLADAFGDRTPGRPTIWATWVATGVQVVVSAFALLDESRFLGVFFASVLVLFALGSALFVIDIVLAAARSTRDSMGIGGLFFLVGSAPRGVTLSMNASLAVAILTSVAVAIARISTPELAFGTLAPILQLALSGFWGVRHGSFEPRREGSAGSRVGSPG